MGRPLSAILVALTLAACRAGVNASESLASDEWIRSFTPIQGAAVEIVNRNGNIEVEGVDTEMIEVRAARRARARSDQVARDVLAGLVISETTGPGGLVIRTEGVKGVLIGARFEVDYHARVPRTQAVRLRANNGSITVRGLSSQVGLFAGNGTIVATELSGGVDARATNGRVRVALSALGDDPVSLRASNGRVDLVLPDEASALVQATAENGQVEVVGLTLDPIGEQTRRRVRGRLGEGRTPVDATAVNGAVRISNPASALAP